MLQNGLIGHLAVDRRKYLTRVRAGAVGILPVGVFARQVDKSALADFEAVVGPKLYRSTVVDRRVGASGQSVEGIDCVVLGVSSVVKAVGSIGREACLLFKNNVDNTRNGVGAVLRRRTVAQNLDAIDGRGQNGVHVRADRPAVDRAVDVDQRRLMASLAVDKHQQLVGAQAAQLRGVDVVGAVGDGLPGRLKRGCNERQYLVDIDLPDGIGYFGQRNHIDRHGRVDLGAAAAARSGHDDFVEQR